MKFFRKLLGINKAKDATVKNFWDWFIKHEKVFYHSVKNDDKIDGNFFKKISPELNKLRKGIFYLTGMDDENTVELVLTPDGNIRNIGFIEKLIDSSPKIQGWKFTSLKPAMNKGNFVLRMAGHEFHEDNIFFFSNDDKNYPDEIDLTIIHSNSDNKNSKSLNNGIHLFLDNYLGELKAITVIDNIEIKPQTNTNNELISIKKLNNYLTWRQKEFIEKYKGIWYDSDKDEYTLFEAISEDDLLIITVANADVLKWDKKASHPWILKINILYDEGGESGMPNDNTLNIMDKLEEVVMNQLINSQGYINIGRETGQHKRMIYFACKDFRKPSEVIHNLIKNNPNININFDIYKDKYWRTFNKYTRHKKSP